MMVMFYLNIITISLLSLFRIYKYNYPGGAPDTEFTQFKERKERKEVASMDRAYV